MDQLRAVAYAHGHSPERVEGHTRRVVIEKPRTGAVAWVRRRCRFLAEPEPVECIETERVNGMAIRDLELLSVYAMMSMQAPWFGDGG